jgi:hypothetical protein
MTRASLIAEELKPWRQDGTQWQVEAEQTTRIGAP